MRSFRINNVPSIHGYRNYPPDFFERITTPTINFEVGGIPPKKTTKGSIWTQETQVQLLLELRKQALVKRNSLGIIQPLARANIKLNLDIYAPPNILYEIGDLDNLTGGVLDGLQHCPSNPEFKLHKLFNKKEFQDISPKKAIIYDDDSQIISIKATKNQTTGAPYYVVTIRY